MAIQIQVPELPSTLAHQDFFADSKCISDLIHEAPGSSFRLHLLSLLLSCSDEQYKLLLLILIISLILLKNGQHKNLAM